MKCTMAMGACTLLVFCFILCFSVEVMCAASSSDCKNITNMEEDAISKEKLLIKFLLCRYAKYGRVGRPVTNTSDKITVEFGLSLIQIMNVDEKNQVLETNVWFTYQWTDVLLRWDPKEYDGLEKIMVPPEDVWIPDIVLYNFADSRLKEQRHALVNVIYDGSIIWMPQAILRSTCKFNTRYFPFDQNECHLKFGSWTHDGNMLDLVFFQGKENLMTDDFMPGNEWILIGNRGLKTVKYYECCQDTPYLDLKFYMLLKRKTAFYSFILLLPCSLLSCMTLIIFWVPPESPAKLQLGMNIFVAFFVLLLLLAESTPKAAESIPLIGAYFCLSMVMITMSSVLATITANMFFRGVRINRAPAWLRTFLLDYVARALCLRDTLMEKTEDPEKKKNWNSAEQGRYTDSDHKFAKIRLLDNGRDERLDKGMTSCSELLDQNHFTPGNDKGGNTFDALQTSTLAGDIHVIREILERYRDKKAKEELRNKCVREWKVICCVMDRLFFLAYLLINVIGIIVILFVNPI